MLNLLRGNKKMDFYKSLQLEFFRPYATDTGFHLKAGVDGRTAWWRWWLTRHTMARATAVEVTSITQRYCTEVSILINANIAKGTDVCFCQLQPPVSDEEASGTLCV